MLHHILLSLHVFTDTLHDVKIRAQCGPHYHFQDLLFICLFIFRNPISCSKLLLFFLFIQLQKSFFIKMHKYYIGKKCTLCNTETKYPPPHIIKNDNNNNNTTINSNEPFPYISSKSPRHT